jgi:protein-L-isoaspartate(D-aspartate) O-methyltransferase
MRLWKRCFLAILLASLFTPARAADNAAKANAEFAKLREEMVKADLVAGGIKHPDVLRVMKATPRHEFIPPSMRGSAYFDTSLAIGDGQTISAPFVVAQMLAKLDLQSTDNVLEIGTGSGYNAALLSQMAKDVYSIEICPRLATQARVTVAKLGYANVHVKEGDGFKGWPEHAPFDKIVVTCAPADVPEPLIAQLKEGGTMLIPVGSRFEQILFHLKKEYGQLSVISRQPTYFVPMTGAAQEGVATAPTNTEIINGSLERMENIPGLPDGWYSLKQVDCENGQGRSGSHGFHFSNNTPGRSAYAMQAFAVDGRKSKLIDISAWVRGQSLRTKSDAAPARIAITYYDQNQLPAGEGSINLTSGDQTQWHEVTGRLPVPPQARWAVFAVTLGETLGDLWADDFSLQPVSVDQIARQPRP